MSQKPISPLRRRMLEDMTVRQPRRKDTRGLLGAQRLRFCKATPEFAPGSDRPSTWDIDGAPYIAETASSSEAGDAADAALACSSR